MVVFYRHQTKTPLDPHLGILKGFFKNKTSNAKSDRIIKIKFQQPSQMDHFLYHIELR